jgi:hypothetical protein
MVFKENILYEKGFSDGTMRGATQGIQDGRMTSKTSSKAKKSPRKKFLKKNHSNNAAIAKAIAYLIRGSNLKEVTEIGDLKLPKGDEAEKCLQIMNILMEYVVREKVSSPFSIAVFGPPGSGKSFYVKQILEFLKTELAKENVRQFVSKQVVVNLSQLSSHKELADAFNKSSEDEEITRVFFFDEFDTPLNGISLGWLRWFLAPMQDGQFFCDGMTISIKKAIFVFAGGTAATFDEFRANAESGSDFREKKVPDFISRLRGFIDIQGINQWTEDRSLQRALVLRSLLDRRWPKLCKEGAAFPIDEILAGKLLSKAHFVHGVRSMEALLDMSPWDQKGTFSEKHLPDNQLKVLHISRGLLDNKMIGISTGQKELKTTPFVMQLTVELLQNGATLAYGGDFVEEGTLHRIVEAAEAVPDDLVERSEKRIHNYLGFPSYNRVEVQKQHDKWETRVAFHRLPTLSEQELTSFGLSKDKWFHVYPRNESETYNPKDHLAWALSLFRMRIRLIQDISALIVIGGKDGESWGRFSGIAEEVMLALVLDKPVYVLGGQGGAAEATGRLLGLGENQVSPETCLRDDNRDQFQALYEDFTHHFAMSGYSNLPVTLAELRNYLFEHSVTTSAWPSNGLTLTENRELFQTPITQKEWGRRVDLIIRGLTRLNKEQ